MDDEQKIAALDYTLEKMPSGPMVAEVYHLTHDALHVMGLAGKVTNETFIELETLLREFVWHKCQRAALFHNAACKRIQSIQTDSRFPPNKNTGGMPRATCRHAICADVRKSTGREAIEGFDSGWYAEAALNELEQAQKNWPAFNSAHEGFAVLQEEVDELWQHVKTKQTRRDLGAMEKEAIQVAAMALRFAMEVCTEQRGRK